MPKPVLTVEIAFDSGYATPAASRTWTDVTSKVLHEAGIRITKWRGEEHEVANASRLSLTLKNADGRYTPGNASGAHYPNVKKGRPIRVTVTHNSNTYRRFLGYIEDWEVGWPGVVAGSSVCVVTASSRMARLGAGMELKSIIEEETLPDDPVVYYTFGEPTGATRASDSSGNAGPTLVQAGSGTSVNFGTDTGPGTDSLTAARFTAGGKFLISSKKAFTYSNAAAVLSCFVATTSGTNSWFFQMLGSGSTYMTVGIDAANGQAFANLQAAATFMGVGALGPAVDDGAVHHIAAKFSGTTLTLYVDGVSVGTDVDAAAVLPTFHSLYLAWGGGTPGETLSVAHAGVFPTLSDTRVLAHADAGLNGFAGETAAARLARYAGYAGIPTAEQSFETGDVPSLAHIDTTGKKPLACMREVETTEAGVLFDAGDGTLKFHDRSHRYAAASAFSTSLSPVVVPLAPILDDQQLVNDMTATGSTGVSGRVTDQTSLDAYGRYDESLDIATSDVDEPQRAASWRVGRYAEPLTRIPAVEIHLNKASVALTDSVLAAEVGTKFTLTGLPSNAPASTAVLFVEGEEEYIDATEHRVVLKTSAAEVFDVWILGDSTYGVLGSTTRLAY